MVASVISLPTRIVESDRLPSCSQVTMDIELDNGFKWMEPLPFPLSHPLDTGRLMQSDRHCCGDISSPLGKEIQITVCYSGECRER